jgi:CHAT domain-containing protein/cytochrome c-type biogenesis protein CcmH/NrfG
LDENLQGHLWTAELARLLEQSRLREDLAPPMGDLHPHLAACMSCREQLEELVLFDRKLKSVNRSGAPAPQLDCPVPATWREVAGGLTPPLQTLGYIEHASRCNSCGRLLREAIVDLNGLSQGLSEAEKKYIATLESSNPEWRQRLACRITGTLPSDRKSARGLSRWLGSPRLAIAGVSLLGIIIAASWVLVRRNQPPNAERLLARAYTETRTLELRMAGADYAPLRISRGPQASFASRSPALLKAEALIATQLQSHPSDPAWLQAKAQADLLEGKYDAAVEALRRALELEPHSPSLLTDLATAYFQRAQQEDKKDDFGAAYELLSQALRLRPDDPVVLFNRAIVAEHQFLYQQALDDWDHYLHVDPASQWEGEARNHANSIREIIKQHGKATPLLSPATVVAARSGASAHSEVDERIEEYLHEAVVSWLPQAFPESPAIATSDAPKALFFLAELSQQGHGDRWLTDLLRESSAPHFPQAVTALAHAVKANDAGEYDVSRQQAELAEKLFRASGNMAGVLRAQFEHIFSEQMTRRSEACRRQATAALADSEKYSYSWLQIQLGLEKSVCSFLMGDIGADEKANARSELLAQQSAYGGLYLRAILFAAEGRLATGDQTGGAAAISTGLERYWSGKFPDLRGYNLYAGLADIAEAAARPNLELAIWREAVALIDTDEDLLLRAMAHKWMANAAKAAHLPKVAEQQYAQAARLFAAVPRTEANRNDGLQAEIRTAQLESHQGRSDDAIARLTSIQDQVRPLSNNYLVQMFYSTLGELQLGRHRETEAEQALGPALALAEQSLASLGSDTERTSWRKDASPAYLALVEAQLVQGRSQDALETYEWYLGAPQRVFANTHRHRAFTNPPMPIPSGLASRLPILTTETVLAYAILPDGLAVWEYDDRGINTRWVPKSTDGLQELAERFRDLASDPSSELSALRRDARSLYGSLIAPVEQHLAPGRTLVIETDGWLARVPFEALLDSNDHYLIERASMVHSLGQDSQARLRNGTGISADMPAFVLGSTASSAADGLIPLPDVAEEADTVARSFHSPRVFKGVEATLDAVRSELPHASVFHFAGHSLAAPQGTGLLLESKDRKTNTRRLMDANVVRQLRLQNLQLAVLSACGTASGGTGSNGFDSVTDALLRAGAPHVVASRWAVDSAETRGFVEDFYRNALSGHTVSEAIRLTSRNMLANPRTSHPYYWSAFAAYGRP